MKWILIATIFQGANLHSVTPIAEFPSVKSCEAEGFSLTASHAGLIEARYAHFKTSGIIQSTLITDCIKVPNARSPELGDSELSESYRTSTTRERADEVARLHEAE